MTSQDVEMSVLSIAVVQAVNVTDFGQEGSRIFSKRMEGQSIDGETGNLSTLARPPL